jgi:methionine synthase I (cobalamin-dependent)
MAQAMEQTQIPYIISFMIRNNGCLIDGTSIHDAIIAIDEHVKVKPVCYMTNCVHPKVLYEALNWDFNRTEAVKRRFHGIQANTSPLPPEELDHSEDLKCSDAVTLAKEMLELSQIIDVKIYGGCCGTDHTHMEEIAKRIKI